jgi:hypothetical protein
MLNSLDTQIAVLTAVRDGKPIQYEHLGRWEDCTERSVQRFREGSYPVQFDQVKYRVKPEYADPPRELYARLYRKPIVGRLLAYATKDGALYHEPGAFALARYVLAEVTDV